MKIVNMEELSKEQLAQAAQMLTDELPLGWATFDDAMEEVNGWVLPHDCSDRSCMWREKEKTTFLAVVEENDVIGWCGILPSYSGRVFELHPLVVKRDKQRIGVGTMLVEALSKIAREQGGLTLWLGADDEAPGGETSLANTNLYDDLPGHIRDFKSGTHPAAFYLKLGFKITGVVPDANGIGKPDIFFSKSLY